MSLRHKLSAIAIVSAWALALAPRTLAAAGDKAASARLVDEAEGMITQASRSDPLDAEQVRAAIGKLNRAVSLDPRNDGAYVDLGFSYALLKDASTALDMYTRATRINPSAANFKELADIYLRVGSPGNALMAANAGLSKDDRNAGLYNARGMALVNMRRFDEAARDFRKALDIDPSLSAAQVNLEALGSGYSGRSTIMKKKAAEQPQAPGLPGAVASPQPPVTGFSGSGIQ